MDSLRSLASPTGFVTRSGETSQVPAKHIVPGDIVHIKMGDVVPADIRLFQCVGCSILSTHFVFLTVHSVCQI